MGFDGHFARQQFRAADVRFVPIADIYSYSIKIKLRGGAARRRGKSVVDAARPIKDIESHRSE